MSPVAGLDGAVVLILIFAVLLLTPTTYVATPFPLKTVEASSPDDELNVSLDAADLRFCVPVADVANKGKQVVSDVSSATAT